MTAPPVCWLCDGVPGGCPSPAECRPAVEAATDPAPPDAEPTP